MMYFICAFIAYFMIGEGFVYLYYMKEIWAFIYLFAVSFFSGMLGFKFLWEIGQ